MVWDYRQGDAPDRNRPRHEPPRHSPVGPWP